jgi:hypothetical protein
MHVDRKTRYQQMRAILNEKPWRQLLALEAQQNGLDTMGTEGVGGVSFEPIAEDIRFSNPSEGSGSASELVW